MTINYFIKITNYLIINFDYCVMIINYFIMNIISFASIIIAVDIIYYHHSLITTIISSINDYSKTYCIHSGKPRKKLK